MKWLENIEGWILGVISKVGVWITPLVPAYFVQRAMVLHMQAPEQWGWLAAAALEIVGIAATKNLLRAYTWEQERRKTDPAAPMTWYVVAAVVYYAAAFLMVLGVELWPEATKAAPAAFVVLSGTAALVIALSDDHNRRERAVRQVSVDRSARRSGTGVSEPARTVSEPAKPVSTPDIDKLQAGRKAAQAAAEQRLLTFLAGHPQASHGEAAQVVGRSRPWVTGKLAEWEEAGVLHRNGRGIELVK